MARRTGTAKNASRDTSTSTSMRPVKRRRRPSGRAWRNIPLPRCTAATCCVHGARRRLQPLAWASPYRQRRLFVDHFSGVLQGVTSQEARVQYPDVFHHHHARTPDYDYENGESLIVFAARVMAGLEALAARHPSQSVLIFTHGGVLDVRRIERRLAGRWMCRAISRCRMRPSTGWKTWLAADFMGR